MDDRPGGIGPPHTPSKSIPSSLLRHRELLQPLTPCKVRWLYKDGEKWKPFCGGDSLNIEKAYRHFKSLNLDPKDDSGLDLSSIICTTVRGSLYEADLLDLECRPLFWIENAVPIKRGTWFIADVPNRWEAIDEHDSVIIEAAHIDVINSMGFGAPPSPTSASHNVLHQIKLGSYRIEWRDIDDVYMISESTGSRLVQKIGFSGPRKLNRGYEVECEESDILGPITHIVFLVHGIGQLYYGEGGGIVNSRKKLVKSARMSSNLHSDSSPTTDSGERVEFFPIEWRTNLKLDEGIIDSITPENLNSLRKMLNATTMDVLYYASPLYREEIIQTIREKLNLVYRQYTDRNPSFEASGGKVSIIAHSLGSVIMYDMLTLWNSYLLEKDKSNADKNVASESSFSWWSKLGVVRNSISPEAKKVKSREKNSHTDLQVDGMREELHNARLKVSELEAKLNSLDQSKYNAYRDNTYSLLFKVENVFNIGSPLGVFLVMRGVRPRQDLEQHLLPTSVCKRTLNIYDPADPIAYRLEPLIYSHYSSIPPVRLAHMHVQTDSSSSSSSSLSGINIASKAEWLKSWFSSPKTAGDDDPLTMSGEENMDTDVSSEVEKRVLLHRVDYVLEASLVEYISALTSHQAYWQNSDLAKFVMDILLKSNEDMDVASRL